MTASTAAAGHRSTAKKMLRGHCLVASLTAFCGVFLGGSLVFIGFMFKDMHDLVHSAKEDLKEYNFYSDDAWDMMAKKPGMFPDSRDRRAAYDSSSNSYQPYGGGNTRAKTSNYGQEDDTNSGYEQGRNGHWPAIKPQQNRPSYNSNTAKPSSGGYISGFRLPTSATKRPSTSGYNGYGTNPLPPTAAMYVPSGRSSYNPYGTPSSNPYTTSRTTNNKQCQCEDMISSNCPSGPAGPPGAPETTVFLVLLRAATSRITSSLRPQNAKNVLPVHQACKALQGLTVFPDQMAEMACRVSTVSPEQVPVVRQEMLVHQAYQEVKVKHKSRII
ncbi:hypothetical protein WR25_26958 [Diploscapter pachys]|uniref:Nematode cuticle collagen N-terminal domain-containing protein n=1 Tax=Diploscapter pachys TaxID=2018661 RepID=A0A2A2KZ82_9BILA|nr:hypothetical protein WR25_26958 [Diploscapter pachys]